MLLSCLTAVTTCSASAKSTTRKVKDRS